MGFPLKPRRERLAELSLGLPLGTKHIFYVHRFGQPCSAIDFFSHGSHVFEKPPLYSIHPSIRVDWRTAIALLYEEQKL